MTNRRACSPCPAYRGIRSDTSPATGLWPDGTPYGLAAREHVEYEAALTAALEDDDFGPITAWETRLAEGIGDRTLRELGDPDALDRRAAYMRAYRQRRPGYDKSTARVARHRARGCNVTTPNSPVTATSAIGLSGRPRARTREG